MLGVLADEDVSSVARKVPVRFFTRTMQEPITTSLARGGAPAFSPMERIFNALGSDHNIEVFRLLVGKLNNVKSKVCPSPTPSQMRKDCSSSIGNNRSVSPKSDSQTPKMLYSRRSRLIRKTAAMAGSTGSCKC